MADLDLVTQHVVPNNNPRLQVASLLFSENGEELAYDDIVAWIVFINGGTDINDEISMAWSIPVVSNGTSGPEYIVFDSATTEWWTRADLSGTGEESLLAYLSKQ